MAQTVLFIRLFVDVIKHFTHLVQICVGNMIFKVTFFLFKSTLLTYCLYVSIYRSYSLKYLKDNVVDGIKTFDFHLPKTMFYNSTYNPDNDGFCHGTCLGNGVLNISACYGGTLTLYKYC